MTNPAKLTLDPATIEWAAKQAEACDGYSAAHIASAIRCVPHTASQPRQGELTEEERQFIEDLRRVVVEKGLTGATARDLAFTIGIIDRLSGSGAVREGEQARGSEWFNTGSDHD